MMPLFDNGSLVVREISPTPTRSSGLRFERRRFEDEPELDVEEVDLLVNTLEVWLNARGRR